MSSPLRKPFRVSALTAALVLLAGCGGEPTAPVDPLDAESLANRLEGLSRRAPQMDRVLLSAAGVHFRDAGRVTPISVVIDGQAETWYAATSETVFPPLPCLAPTTGISCPGIDAITQQNLFAVNGVDATRLLVFSTMAGLDAMVTPPDPEWPRLPPAGILLERGRGVQAFASGGSVTSSLTSTLGSCPVPPRRRGAGPPIESCERVSIAWEVDVDLTPLRTGEAAPATISVVTPASEISGARLVLGPPTLPRR